MKINKKLFKNVAVVTGLLGLGTFIGVLITTTPSLAKFTLPKIAYLKNLVSPQTISQNVEVDSTDEKKQELEAFYKELTEAESKGDYEKLYSTINPSDKKWFSFEDMILIHEGNKPVSIEYIVHSISVLNDTGSVDRTVIACSTKECVGNDRKEQRGIKEFVYINKQWYQQPQKEPSEKARQLAAYMYTNSNNQTRKKLADKYAGGVDDYIKIIRTWSIVLENNPELMAYDEALVEKHKAESSKPNVYVEAPDVIQQPAPVIQQQTYPRNCTSTTIGNYTYTNCY